MQAHPELAGFLAPYDIQIQALALELRTFITDLVPNANELIWDNYNAVAIAYSKSEKLQDAFCHLAVYTKHVNFGFNRGVELPPNDLRLEGKGKLIRHLKVTDITSFPKVQLSPLIWEAVGISEKRNPSLLAKQDLGRSLVMSVSAKKIRPN